MVLLVNVSYFRDTKCHRRDALQREVTRLVSDVRLCEYVFHLYS